MSFINNVLGVIMPSDSNSKEDEEDGYAVAKAIDIKTKKIDISPIIKAVEEEENGGVIPKIKISSSDKNVFRVDKRTYSRFYNTVLDNFLRNNNIKEVYIAGLVTSICGQHTAADAFFRGYKVNIVENGCADINTEKHENYIEYMKNNYSAR